jgi:hypothetical protein
MRRLDRLIRQSWFENCPAITHAKDSDESDKSIPVEKKQGSFQLPSSKGKHTLLNGVCIAPKHIAKHLCDFQQCWIENSSLGQHMSNLI